MIYKLFVSKILLIEPPHDVLEELCSSYFPTQSLSRLIHIPESLNTLEEKRKTSCESFYLIFSLLPTDSFNLRIDDFETLILEPLHWSKQTSEESLGGSRDKLSILTIDYNNNNFVMFLIWYSLRILQHGKEISRSVWKAVSIWACSVPCLSLIVNLTTSDMQSSNLIDKEILWEWEHINS